MIPVDSFFRVHFFFQFEGVIVEVLLQHLIRVVDAELLKRVVVKNFKSKDIKNANVQG